jgi:hypothetical protein
MQVTKEAGVWLRRGEPGFDTAVLATSFNARDPGRRPEWLVQANDVFGRHVLRRAQLGAKPYP